MWIEYENKGGLCTMSHITRFDRMWGMILEKFIKGTRGFTIKKPPQILPGSARQSSLPKRSQDRKAPVSMFDVDSYAQLTPTISAQASFGKR